MDLVDGGEGGRIFTGNDAEIGCRMGDRSRGLRREVLERVLAICDHKRVAARAGSMSNFEVGDYLLMARVRELGSAPKLVTAWTGPWHVISGGYPRLYNVQEIVTGETKEFYVVRMRAYGDSSLAVGAEVQGLFEMTKH